MAFKMHWRVNNFSSQKSNTFKYLHCAYVFSQSAYEPVLCTKLKSTGEYRHKSVFKDYFE